MRVSVIVPLYNKGQTIQRSLESITAQTFPDFEGIIVDDGSTDSGPEIVAAYPDPRFRLIRQTNAGPGAARNRGLTEAQAPLVAFLDADDVWHPEYLARSVQMFDTFAHRVATVTSGYVEYPKGASREKLWTSRGIKEGIQRVTPATKPSMLVYMLAYMSPCTTVAKADVVRRWGGFYEHHCRYGEDALLWLKVLLNENVYFQMPPLVAVHREDSMLSSNQYGARPIEPFLLDPEEVARVCPSDLIPLLRQFYVIRACKTASVLGYWGSWRRAQRLFSQFVSLRHWRSPFFASALLGCTPLAGLVGMAWRSIRSLRQRYPT